jgi:N-acetylneuraminate synthase
MKKVLLSTGASTMEEISEAINVIESTGNKDIVLLHCVLNYPTENKNAGLGMVEKLKSFGKEVGYSDHTLPDENMLILTTSVIMGCKWVEKHFTLDKTLPGNDHYHAMSPSDLEKFVNNLNLIQEISGKGDLKTQELSVINARRSVYAKHDLKKGTVLTSEDLICKRPATGISASKFDSLIGRVLDRDIKEDTVFRDVYLT